MIGMVMVLAWPLALLVMRDKPADIGQFADGDSNPPNDAKREAATFASCCDSGPFWLLLIGSLCSIGSIGAINPHMKFVFKDAGFSDQKVLNATWSTGIDAHLDCQHRRPAEHRSSVGYLLEETRDDRQPTSWWPLRFLCCSRSEPPTQPYLFAIVFGFAMGADYMLIPLMAAEQFGVNHAVARWRSCFRVNTIGQTWFPLLVFDPSGTLSALISGPMAVVFGIAMIGALAISHFLATQAPMRQLSEPGLNRRVN